MHLGCCGTAGVPNDLLLLPANTDESEHATMMVLSKQDSGSKNILHPDNSALPCSISQGRRRTQVHMPHLRYLLCAVCVCVCVCAST